MVTMHSISVGRTQQISAIDVISYACGKMSVLEIKVEDDFF